MLERSTHESPCVLALHPSLCWDHQGRLCPPFWPECDAPVEAASPAQPSADANERSAACDRCRLAR